MRLFKYFIIFLTLPCFCRGQNAQIRKLECEYLSIPLGIDNPHPRFTWQMDDSRPGARQTGYQIAVGTDSAEVVKGNGDNWVFHQTNSNTNLAVYNGKPLQPFTKYYWRIILWDKNGRPCKPAASSFETGMMLSSNWQGSWISDGETIKTKAAPYFRKAFETSKHIVSARAYISAVGLYELYVNGQKIGDHRLDPMYTRFDRRTLYVTYDVTANLKTGKNAIGVLLGNGWYNFQSIGVWDFERAPWRNRPAFCLDLRITYSDGSAQVITSGKDWKTSLSPVIYNSIYTGEHYDARMEQPGWDRPDFDDSKWHNVINRQAPAQKIVAQAIQPIRNVEKIVPVTLKKLNDTTYIFDIGRNIAGVTQITLEGDSSTVVRVIHAEKLYPNGYPDQSNVDYFLDTATKAFDPYATDIYRLHGKGPETFMPHFNYKGFQYVEVVSNKPIKLTKESLSAWFMHSDVKQVGYIHTSSDLINKIYEATNASYLSNLFGYPTDCPQREKNGWTGDAHIASETGLYNFDSITVYEKWLADHRDEQQPNGVLPSIIPSDGWGYEWGNGPDWTSTIAIIPWNVYVFYGDDKILRDNYDNIKRYVDHINELYPTGLTTWGLGDWAPVKSKTPVELTSSVYYYVDANILAKTAKLLGKSADAATYSALASKIKNAINAKYLNIQTGQYADGYQTEQAVPLYWGIVPNQLKEKAAVILARSVAANNYHLDVGILGAKAILGALSDNGQAETAYKLATQNTFPSWGWWIVNGATTLYENWNIELKRDLSLNHIMFGEISAWMFKALGGIKTDEAQPGFRHFEVSPNFLITDLESRHDSPFGRITSSWQTKGHQIHYKLIVPPNTSADLDLGKAGKKLLTINGKTAFTNTFRLPAGRYEFTLEL
ncbi:alpha-L-rhamnosidase [Mucilaginibacter sp. BT774]|uniref:alpha-L-rhamnosidase n=1 Tax=Mucilaginibacter sp. BT774 TaxID=3062276 RepID=UPI0026744A05|nr:alpha-L-rhamnosidase [Mucilaginibacter sp. BT774]MDO3628341.1 family 78 glycoside hydrolase catalytic domain [Mucilaginibacter sp. BT774]